MGPCSLSSKGGALLISSKDEILFHQFKRWGLVRSVQKGLGGALFAQFKRDTIVAGIDVNDRGYRKLLVSLAVVYER